MAKDPNAKINKAIGNKERAAKAWREDAAKARRLGNPGLAQILEGRAKQAEIDALNLKKKLK